MRKPSLQRRKILLAVLAVVLIIGGLAAAAAMGLLGPHTFAIPNVTGMSRAAAAATLEQDGFVLGDNLTQQYSTQVETGKVISQAPIAGTMAKKGTSVDLVISKGPELVIVPNLVNKTQAAVAALLQAAGLTGSATSSDYNPSIPAGSVISQKPGKGS